MRKFEIVKDEMRKNPNEEIKLPKRGTINSMAYDFYSPVGITIPPHESRFFWTDVKVIMGKDEGLLINVRSSMGKYPIMLANTQGWIDSDYYSNPSNDGNIGINLFNLSDKPFIISKGDRIAQGMFVKFYITDDDETKEKRIGGFGSTNK